MLVVWAVLSAPDAASDGVPGVKPGKDANGLCGKLSCGPLPPLGRDGAVFGSSKMLGAISCSLSCSQSAAALPFVSNQEVTPCHHLSIVSKPSLKARSSQSTNGCSSLRLTVFQSPVASASMAGRSVSTIHE